MSHQLPSPSTKQAASFRFAAPAETLPTFRMPLLRPTEAAADRTTTPAAPSRSAPQSQQPQPLPPLQQQPQQPPEPRAEPPPQVQQPRETSGDRSWAEAADARMQQQLRALQARADYGGLKPKIQS